MTQYFRYSDVSNSIGFEILGNGKVGYGNNELWVSSGAQ